MMHKSLKLALVGLLVASSASALSEIRSPWITEDGPIRYTFEKLNKDKSNLNFWWAGHYKGASKAFLKLSTKSQPLTALIFGQADFTMNQIFPGGNVPFEVAEYSPFLNLATFSPRANYSEFGFTFGGRWDCPVYEHKGRIGLRTMIPFRRIQIERDDFIDKNANPLTNYVATELVKVSRNNPTFDEGQAGADAATNGSLAQVATAAAVGQLLTQAGANTVEQAVLRAAAKYSTATGNDVLVTAANPGAAAVANGVIGTGSAGQTDAPTVVAALAEAVPTDPNGGDTKDVALSQFVAAVGKGAAASNTPAGIVAAFNAAVLNANNQNELNAVGSRGDRAAVNNQPEVVCTAYRLDLVQQLRDTSQKSALQLKTNARGNPVPTVFGTNIGYAENQFNRGTVALTFGATPAAVIGQGYTAWQTSNATLPGYWQVNPADIEEVDPAHFAVADVTKSAADGKIAEFNAASDYSTLLTADGNFQPGFAATAAQSWLTFRHAADSTDPNKFAPEPTGGVSNAATIANTIAARLQAYRENPYNFLDRKGYDLDTRLRNGLGDIDLDLFYEHTFNPEWMGELWTGVRFPTGGTNNKYGSPYLPILGNGEHFEVKIGAQLCYQPASCMNIKLDTYYSFVLEATEHRMAAFQGATIKNMGPRADADVDWGYFVGRLDFNFFHPKTSDIRSTIGYEFYYKTEDHVTYKQSSMQSWLGALWNPATGTYSLPNLQPLSNALEKSHTEGISHKVRFEVSYQVMKYLEIFSAASTVFAGQNVMADTDANLGFNVRF
jgi:hypothetical protein